ncbi:hypothetical protein ASG90_19945 [Nocardioides sp. Soil797]|nr:hypothetical protein ASG90_19945 [Nocardioides sp. Soil797]
MTTSIETLRAVQHPVRRRIIEYLSVHGASQVTTLARAMDLQVGSISHHLRMLERVDVVQRAPELAADGRTSWWRMPEGSTISWSVDDFADNPADRMQAKAAEKLNIEYQIRKLAAWKKEADRADESWRRAAFSSSTSAVATAEEFSDLQARIDATVREWTETIDKADGQERLPVFVFSHGFPSRP